MIDLYKFTDNEKAEIINSMVILVDTREKKNDHIINQFEKHKVACKKKKLDYGDYSFMIPANEQFGILKDLYFDSKIIVERKGSLEELSTNITKERARFEKELALSPERKVLLIESSSYSDILNGNYNSKTNRKSFLSTLHIFWHRYSIPFVFLPSKESSIFIYKFFESYLKELLN